MNISKDIAALGEKGKIFTADAKEAANLEHIKL